MEQWIEELKERGRKEGRAEGREKGREEGRNDEKFRNVHRRAHKNALRIRSPQGFSFFPDSSAGALFRPKPTHRPWFVFPRYFSFFFTISQAFCS